MSKISNISQSLVERYDITKLDADRFVVELFSVIRESLDKEKVVKVKGLGTFKLSEMNARESVDVNTGERIIIEGRPKITFTPENSVRDRINSPFAQFESIDIDDDVDLSIIDDKYKMSEESEKIEEKEYQTDIKESSEKEEVIDNVKFEKPLNETISHEDSVKEDVSSSPETVESDSIIEKEANNDSATRGLYCEDLIREELTHSRKIIKLLYGVLGFLIVSVLIALAYFGYKISSGSLNISVASTKHPLEKNITVKPKVKKKAIIVLKNIGVTSKSAKENDDPVVNHQLIYNKDARVRTGAYVIVGLDTIVQVKNGQTLSGISKFYLGEDMECYVEVYNGGIKELKPGDSIKIPKLKLKKLLKR